MSPGQVHILERVEQSTLSVIGIGGLVQYIRHSLTAMGESLPSRELLETSIAYRL